MQFPKTMVIRVVMAGAIVSCAAEVLGQCGYAITAPAVLNNNAAIDNEWHTYCCGDRAPHLITDGGGIWLAYWSNSGSPG